jgi:hypothetical protein
MVDNKAFAIVPKSRTGQKTFGKNPPSRHKVRPKAREMTQQGGPPGRLEESDPQPGEICGVKDGLFLLKVFKFYLGTLSL